MRDFGRRQFLQNIGGALSCLIPAARGLASNDPFDALPPEVWRNARGNGLVMIRYPAPAGISSRAKIV